MAEVQKSLPSEKVDKNNTPEVQPAGAWESETREEQAKLNAAKGKLDSAKEKLQWSEEKKDAEENLNIDLWLYRSVVSKSEKKESTMQDYEVIKATQAKEAAQEEYAKSLKIAHSAEITDIVSKNDPGASARAKAWESMLKEDKVMKLWFEVYAQTDEKYKIIPDEKAKKDFIDKKYQEWLSTMPRLLERYRSDPEKGRAELDKAMSEVIKNPTLKEQIMNKINSSGKNIPDEDIMKNGIEFLEKNFLDPDKIHNAITKNITEKWLLAAGIDPTAEWIWSEITTKQIDTLKRYITDVGGENFDFQELPVDVRQRLFLDYGKSDSTFMKELTKEWKDGLPSDVDRSIERTKRELFRQKTGEDATAHQARIQKEFEEVTWTSFQDVSHQSQIDKSKWHPLFAFFVDMLAPFGALMWSPSGDFWRNYIKSNSNSSQKDSLIQNGENYGGKEGAEGNLPESSRKSYEQNLSQYDWCDPKKRWMLMWEVSKMRSNQSRYEAVSKRLEPKKVPWEVIAAIHYRECSGRFDQYLHQGDPIWKPSRRVPKWVLFHNWEDAAVDAIRRERYFPMNTADKNWLVNIAAYAESYNWPAYKNRGKNSPYVWAWSGGIGVAGLIKVDHGPITNEQDSRLGIMPIVLELAWYTSGGVKTEKYDQILKSSTNENNTTNPAVASMKESAKGQYKMWANDCMTSVNTALGLNWGPLSEKYGALKIQPNSWSEQDLWNVSMAAAEYTGFSPSVPTGQPIPLAEDGWYGGGARASDYRNVEYFIEENIMKRVNSSSEGMDNVGHSGLLVHYSKQRKWVEGITQDIQDRLHEWGVAMMGGTWYGTNKKGHEWLVSKENGIPMVYETTDRANWKRGEGVPLAEYLNTNRGEYRDEAIIFAKQGWH